MEFFTELMTFHCKDLVGEWQFPEGAAMGQFRLKPQRWVYHPISALRWETTAGTGVTRSLRAARSTRQIHPPDPPASGSGRTPAEEGKGFGLVVRLISVNLADPCAGVDGCRLPGGGAGG